MMASRHINTPCACVRAINQSISHILAATLVEIASHIIKVERCGKHTGRYVPHFLIFPHQHYFLLTNITTTIITALTKITITGERKITMTFRTCLMETFQCWDLDEATTNKKTRENTKVAFKVLEVLQITLMYFIEVHETARHIV